MHLNNSTANYEGNVCNQNEKVKKENENLNKHFNRIISLLGNGSTENRLQAAQILEREFHMDIIKFETICPLVNYINKNHRENEQIGNNLKTNFVEEYPVNSCESFDSNSIKKSFRFAAKQQEPRFFENEMQTGVRSSESLFLRSSLGKYQYKPMGTKLFTGNDGEILSVSQSIQMSYEIGSNLHEGIQQYQIERKEMDLTAHQQQIRERNKKYRQKKMTEDPEEFRRNKSLSQKRYLARLREQNPEEFQMRKACSQKLYMLKKKLNKI